MHYMNECYEYRVVAYRFLPSTKGIRFFELQNIFGKKVGILGCDYYVY